MQAQLIISLAVTVSSTTLTGCLTRESADTGRTVSAGRPGYRVCERHSFLLT